MDDLPCTRSMVKGILRELGYQDVSETENGIIEEKHFVIETKICEGPTRRKVVL